jgi:hypothetical protein
LRRDKRRRVWVCLDCLAVRDRPVVERALGPAAEAFAWLGGRVSLVITPYSEDRSVPTPRWPVVLQMERYRGNLKIDAVTLVCCADLVDATPRWPLSTGP